MRPALLRESRSSFIFLIPRWAPWSTVRSTMAKSRTWKIKCIKWALRHSQGGVPQSTARPFAVNRGATETRIYSLYWFRSSEFVLSLSFFSLNCIRHIGHIPLQFNPKQSPIFAIQFNSKHKPNLGYNFSKIRNEQKVSIMSLNA